MRIGIYQETSGPSLGGSEYVTAVAAQALRACHHVEIIDHREWMTTKKLSDFFQLDLDGVGMRHCPPSEGNWLEHCTKWWQLGAEQRAWRAQVSALRSVH